MRIVQLTAENVKRLRAVRIKPDGSLIQITGRNGQGKSSVLDAIAYGLGGKSVQPAQPVRRGEERAQVVLDLGDKIIRRTWSAAGGTYLSVESRDGAKYPTPQRILDDLVGQLTFDPLEFSRMTPRDQVATLKAVAGLDFTTQDAERAEAYDERTQINRQVKTAEAQLAGADSFEGVPDAEIDLGELTRRQAEASERIRDNDRVRQQAEPIRQRIANGTDHISRLQADRETTRLQDQQRIERLTAELEQARADAESHERQYADDLSKSEHLHDGLKAELATTEARIGALTDPNIEAINAELRAAEETNRRVRAKQQHAQQQAALVKLKGQAKALTDRIEQIDQTKADALAAAEIPVDGLGFDENGVTLNGLPFEQASSAEQLRVSVGMGIALNPELRVMLCRDGSLLDQESLALLAQMAEQHDAQVWLERVADGQPVGVVIEDGQVVGSESNAEPEAEPVAVGADG